jgi:hypothetical protein
VTGVRAPAGAQASSPVGADAPSAHVVGENQAMAFFRSRALLVSVGVVTIVALSMSMAVMFI